jgi:hypothetical protein
MEMTSYAKARSNLCTFNDATTEKQSLDLHFLSSPKSTWKKQVKKAIKPDALGLGTKS